MFEANRKAHKARVDAAFDKLFVIELAMGGRGRMQDTGADVCHMHFQGTELQAVYEAGSCLASACQGKGNDASAAFGQILLRKMVIRACGKAVPPV